MDENEVITPQTGNETIEEGTDTQDPASENTETDKSNVEGTVEPTSETDGGEDENFLGTFKTKEDADKGFKDAQAKITEQANKIKELEAAAKKQDINFMSPENVERKVAIVKQNVIAEYNQRLQGLGYKYGSYLPNDAVINNENDIIKYLPSEQAAQFMAELMNINNDCNFKLKSQTDAVYSEVNKAYEETKAKDKERYNNGKTGEMIFNAWYNPPETIDDVAKLFEDYKTFVIEEYIKELAANKEDTVHKDKLNTNAGTGKAKYGSGHIFTRKEIENMSTKEFLKYEKEIDAQIAKGLIN